MRLPNGRLAESYGGDAAGGRFDSSCSPTPAFEQRRPTPQSGNYYKSIEARDQAKQLNGDVEDPDYRSPAKSNHYEGLTATGCSLQLNGNMSSAAFIGSTFGK